jgi:hypothetical protein
MSVVLCPGIEDSETEVWLDAERVIDLRVRTPKNMRQLVSDLGGRLTTHLDWSKLGPEDFERLIFLLVSDTPGYENIQWLTNTKASDRGRDLSAVRIQKDDLSGTIRSRVIIQCKHWIKKTVNADTVTQIKQRMLEWEPPRVDILIIATSGRFSGGAVSLVEKHNMSDRALRIELWAGSHLEMILAKKLSLMANFGLY